jgi:hypothetical protein
MQLAVAANVPLGAALQTLPLPTFLPFLNLIPSMSLRSEQARLLANPSPPRSIPHVLKPRRAAGRQASPSCPSTPRCHGAEGRRGIDPRPRCAQRSRGEEGAEQLLPGVAALCEFGGCLAIATDFSEKTGHLERA